ncbi:hypothetical protein NC652_010780 [Populus alba x Populus x berolinensis]|nr:hypothetical protein NC652_010780 [Populus alba x Populus x berolinensis]
MEPVRVKAKTRLGFDPAKPGRPGGSTRDPVDPAKPGGRRAIEPNRCHRFIVRCFIRSPVTSVNEAQTPLTMTGKQGTLYLNHTLHLFFCSNFKFITLAVFNYSMDFGFVMKTGNAIFCNLVASLALHG